MFGTDKIHDRVKAKKKKHGPVYWVILIFVSALEAMFGLNAAFLVFQSVSIVMQRMLANLLSVQLISVIIAAVSGVFGLCLVAGGVWVFAQFKDSLEDAKAYVQATGESRWNVNRLHMIKWAIYAIDFTTLAFRASYFAENGALALIAFFSILIFLPGPLGGMLYVHEHTPRHRRLTQARQLAESLEVDEINTIVQTMDADLRARWLADDPTALSEHYQRIADMQQDAYEYEQGQIEKQQQANNNPLATASLAQIDQAPRRSRQNEA